MRRKRTYREVLVWFILAAVATLFYGGYRIYRALPHNVLGISPKSVVKITMISPENNCTIENINGTWYFTTPVRGKAVPPRVSELLDQIKDLKDKRKPVKVENESIYELDRPQLRVVYTTRKGKKYEIIYGSDSSTGAFKIAKVIKDGKSDGKAHFISRYIFTTYRTFLNDLPVQKEKEGNLDTYSG